MLEFYKIHCAKTCRGLALRLSGEECAVIIMPGATSSILSTKNSEQLLNNDKVTRTESGKQIVKKFSK